MWLLEMVMLMVGANNPANMAQLESIIKKSIGDLSTKLEDLEATLVHKNSTRCF